MARLRRRFFRGNTRTRRKRVWAHHNENFTPTAQTGSVDIMGDIRSVMGLTAGPIGATFGGMHMQFQCLFQDSAAIEEQTGVYVGIGKHSRQLATTEVPRPLSDTNEDWLWRKWYPISGFSSVLATASGAGTALRIVSFHEVIRSMRKMEEPNDTIWFVWETTGGVNCELFLNTSTLLLLP